MKRAQVKREMIQERRNNPVRTTRDTKEGKYGKEESRRQIDCPDNHN